MGGGQIALDPNAVPQPEEKKAPVGFDPASLLSRLDSLEKGHKLLNNTIDFVKGTNQFVLAVLFMGFIAMLASFISGVIQATNSNSATQIEFIKSLDSLSTEMKSLSKEINAIKPTSTPTQIVPQ